MLQCLSSSGFATPSLERSGLTATGTIKWFYDEKVGFNMPDGRGEEQFVYRSGIASGSFHTRADGAKVSFETEPVPLGARRLASGRSLVG